MKILFIGKMSDNAEDRARALEALGCEVERISDQRILCSSFLNKVAHRGYGAVLQFPLFLRCLQLGLFRKSYDCVFLNQSIYLGPRIIRQWQKQGAKVVNYVNDDPFGNEQQPRWKLFFKSIRVLDAVIVVRDENIAEATERGARRVIKVMMSAEPLRHHPIPWNLEDEKRWSTDLAFVGTWFPERGPFIAKLIRAGFNISIYGNNWEKAPEWPEIKHCFKSRMILGDDYVKAIQYAKINIGLLSKENRDQYTIRSFEIPAIGALLCGERTEVHCQLYSEAEEAVFFDDVDECIQVCKELLAEPEQIGRIAKAGHERFLRDGSTNIKVMEEVLKEIDFLPVR